MDAKIRKELRDKIAHDFRVAARLNKAQVNTKLEYWAIQQSNFESRYPKRASSAQQTYVTWSDIEAIRAELERLTIALFERSFDLEERHQKRDPLDAKTIDSNVLSVLQAWAQSRPFSDDEMLEHWKLLKTSRIYTGLISDAAGNLTYKPTDREPVRAPNTRRTRAQGFLDWYAEKQSASRRKIKSAVQKPAARLIRSPRDAELVALDWMLYWGFDDASATPVGPDEGIDVASSRAVAQVKAFMVPIGRPELQNLAGVAAVEKKIPLFFALNGYTPQAIEWGNKANMALFTFDLQGNPEPVNDEARKYFA